MAATPSLKLLTARTLKWNFIDKVASQVLYAVTGIVLARELTQEAFGLIGAILVFQAFASLMVDSGFSYALLQRKSPTSLDYSTVLWFNLTVAVALYFILFFCAPGIADIFGADARLIPLSRVMFLSFIINATAIVQTNRFMKQLNVRPVAVANAAGLVAGGIVGIWLAVTGFEAWAIVWQTLTLAAVKSAVLWVSDSWRPLFEFSWARLRTYFRVGGSMMFTSFLNTLFLNIYSFFIGNRVGLVSLGYYTQSDKWSKMCVTSVTQTLTSTFLPVLSSVQHEAERYGRLASKMNRMTAYVTFPLFVGLIVVATPVFHTLFGPKWDASIILFQLLLFRGIFTNFTSLYTNFLLSLGHASAIAKLEIWRDVVAVVCLLASFPVLADTLPGNPVWGVTVMLWGQVAAAVVAWCLTLYYVKRLCGLSVTSLLRDCVPYVVMTAVMVSPMFLVGNIVETAWLDVVLEVVLAAGVYVGLNSLLGSKIQQDAFSYIKGRL